LLTIFQNLIGDNEIPLEGDDQAKLAQLTKVPIYDLKFLIPAPTSIQELKELRQSVQPPKKLKTKTKDIKPKQRGKHDVLSLTFASIVSHLVLQARLEGEIRELEKSKALLLAVSDHATSLFHPRSAFRRMLVLPVLEEP
jgi:hypothetical protein